MNCCLICDQSRLEGIYIRTSFICTTCEWNMIHTDTDEVMYHYYVKKLKPIHQLTLNL